jgi:hypothetical protein
LGVAHFLAFGIKNLIGLDVFCGCSRSHHLWYWPSGDLGLGQRA